MKKTLYCLGLLIPLLLPSAQAMTCECETLSGTLQANKTLLSSTCYQLEDCYRVADGYTLTIQPGTMIYGGANSALILEPESVLIAQGTAANPIIFTSDQPAGSRTPGYWSGVVVLGRAPNNQPQSQIEIDEDCLLIAGGEVEHDYSGIIRYVQIHYARHGLSLISVGDGTTVREVQVSHSLENGFQFLGGDVNARYLASYNAGKNDFYASRGYQGKWQFILGFRQDLQSWHADHSHGLKLENDPSGSSWTPLTRPVVSNMTLLGPGYCQSSGIPSAFQHGVLVDKGAGLALYNSVLSSWKEYGFVLGDTVTIGHTAHDLINLSLVSFDDHGTGDYTQAVSGWPGGCAPDMTAWLNQYLWASCSEQGNQFSPISTLGYDPTSLCASGARRDFSLGSNSLLSPAYSGITDLTDPFFDTSPEFRGAMGDTDWTEDWTDWNPQQKEYCQAQFTATSSSRELTLIPNPAKGKLMARFHAPELGIARFRIADKATGQLWYQSYRILMAGPQEVPLAVEGLPPGIYLVQLKLNKYFYYQVLQMN